MALSKYVTINPLNGDKNGTVTISAVNEYKGRLDDISNVIFQTKSGEIQIPAEIILDGIGEYFINDPEYNIPLEFDNNLSVSFEPLFLSNTAGISVEASFIEPDSEKTVYIAVYNSNYKRVNESLYRSVSNRTAIPDDPGAKDELSIKLRLGIPENTNTFSRTLSVIVKNLNGDVLYNIEVIQPGAEEILEIDTDTIILTKDDPTKTLNITSNTNWEIITT